MKEGPTIFTDALLLVVPFVVDVLLHALGHADVLLHVAAPVRNDKSSDNMEYVGSTDQPCLECREAAEQNMTVVFLLNS